MENKKNEEEDAFIGETIFDKYKLLEKIGQGAFGFIYKAQLINTNKFYAIKFEDMNQSQYILEKESYYLSYLNIPQIPKFRAFGYFGSYIILIMELLGKSLDKILSENSYSKLSLRCVCNIAYQLISILEIIHAFSLIHCDLKPENIAIGEGERSNYIYLIDFGLSREYRDYKTKKHFPFVENKVLNGNARYSSINALDGGTQSRKDDLESLGYLIIYLVLGKLPWQGYVSHSNDDKYYKIKEIKKQTTPEQLCNGLPMQFKDYLNYTINLKYEEEPNYDYLKNLFISVLEQKGHKFDFFYDWNKGKQYKIKNYNLNSYKKKANIYPEISIKIHNLINKRKKLEDKFGSDEYVLSEEKFEWNSINNEIQESNNTYDNNSTNNIINNTRRSRRERERKEDSSCCIIF